MNVVSSLSHYESRVLELVYTVEVSGMKLAETLHELEMTGLWRDKTDDDRNFPRNFSQYLEILATQLRDQGVRASSGTFERLLGFYRLYHLELGLDLRTIMRLGMANLDEIRKIIDWNSRTREIGPGTDTKMNREQALTYLQERIEEMETVGLPTEAVKDDVARRLGREPKSVWIAAVRTKDGRCYMTDLVVWDGPTAHRPREGVSEETLNWLASRLRARVKWIDK